MLTDPSGFIYGNSVCVRDNRLRITITSPNCCLLKASKNVFGVGEQGSTGGVRSPPTGTVGASY